MTNKEINIKAMAMCMGIVKELGCDRKQAYAVAKERVIKAAEREAYIDSLEQAPVVTKRRLMGMLNKGTAYIEYTNPKGKELKVYATLCKEKITTSYEIKGRSKTDDKGSVVVYDRRHGCWRTVIIANITSATQYNVF